MTNGQKFTPRLKAGGLWAKTSAKGGCYLTGRLGGVKVLILANKDRQSENDPSHILYFVDGEKLRPGTQDRGGGTRASQVPGTTQRPSQPRRNGPQTHADANDDVPPWER
jgi:hypothetical protein